MAQAHARLDRVLCWVENAAAASAGVALAAAMVLVSCDAILRHFFAAPLTFQFQLTESYLMVFGIMLALPWGYRTGGKIQVLMLLDALGPFLRSVLFRAGLIVSAVYMAVLGWRSFLVAQEAFANHELIMGVIDWPVGWSWIWVPVGCVLLAARLGLDAAAPVLPDIEPAAETGQPR